MMEQITAAEAGAWGLRLYFHEGDSFRTETVPFSPFVLLAADAAVPDNCTVEKLHGSGYFCRKATFSSFDEYIEKLPELKKSQGVMTFNSLLQQALTDSAVNLFCGMSFDQLRKVCFAVSGSESITALSVTDSSGNSAVFDGDEKDIISRFNDWIKKFDPDIICGFNCCREALPLLIKRAKKLKITLDCGRNGSTFAARNSRYTAGEKQYSYQKFTLDGRHIIDILHAVQLYDAAHRDIEELELPALKEYFALNGETDDQLIAELAEILLPACFYRTAELPLGFQETLLRGSGSALDALLIASYLQQKRSIPLPEAARRYSGALTGMENSGVFRCVRHCDVRSLYPSLLLMYDIAPARDDAGVFLALLKKLRTFRLAAKDRARQLPDGTEKKQYEALQSSFKILINSFYGYLGFAQGCFNDYDLAEKITAGGREILEKLTSGLQKCGAVIIEMDTDGIYFQMPPTDSCQIDRTLKALLPDGIELEFDAEYQAMFSYKAKNYALLKNDGTVALTGAALKSRALEPFQRKFILQTITAKLKNDPAAAIQAYEYWKNAIASRTIALEDLAKSEILSDSPENYRRKLAAGSTRRSAAYELALASGKNFRAGDKVRFFVTGSKAKLPVVGNSRLLGDDSDSPRDENSAYYLAKLDSLAETFGVKA